MNWLLCIVLTSTKCHHGSRLLQMLERSQPQLGHLKLFPGPWCQIETSTICPGHWTLGITLTEEICLQSQSQAAKAPTYSHLIPLCSSIRNKTNKQMAEPALSRVPRLIWNILGECLDSDFDSENAGNGIERISGQEAADCPVPNVSLTNILYFLFWARRDEMRGGEPLGECSPARRW